MIKVVVNHNDIVHNFLGISSLANFERVIIVFSFFVDIHLVFTQYVCVIFLIFYAK